MTSVRTRYAELLSLTKQYLLQEFQPSQRIVAESSSYSYFKNLALQRQESGRTVPAPPIPRQNPSPPSNPVPDAGNKAVIKELPPITTAEKAEKVQNAPPATPQASERKVPSMQPVPLPTASPPQERPAAPGNEPAHTPHAFRFALIPPAPPAAVPLDDLKKIVQEQLPQIKLIESVPDDNEAKSVSNDWEKDKVIPQLAILSFNEPAKHKTFLQQIASSLELMGYSSGIVSASKIEQGQGWHAFVASPQLKLVIAAGPAFETIPSLKKYHKESAKHGRHLLGDRPLLLLPDISVYLQEPSLKASLWKTIKDHLSTLKASDE